MGVGQGFDIGGEIQCRFAGMTAIADPLCRYSRGPRGAVWLLPQGADPAVDALIASELQTARDWLAAPQVPHYPDHWAEANRLHLELTRRFG